MILVTTSIGEIPDVDLRRQMSEEDCGDVLIVAREWFYIGNDLDKLAAVSQLTTPNKYVRRDVWGTIKTGLKTNVEASL